MPHQPKFTAFVLAVVFFTLQAFGPVLSAQSAPLSPQELDQLLSPIALYPDSLLSQIMTASTNPQEILDVDNWLYSNQGLTGTALTDAAQQQGFDPAFIALVNFPQVLEMMAQHIDDYAAIGQAFTNDQNAVSDSVQRLRAQAYAAGSLQSNSQQTVQVQQSTGQTIYVIQPANPQVVYVPQYDPTVVYAGPSTGAIVTASLITFGAGIAIGSLIASNQPWGWGGWGWNWGARRVYYNHGYWGGWGPHPYRPPNLWIVHARLSGSTVLDMAATGVIVRRIIVRLIPVIGPSMAVLRMDLAIVLDIVRREIVQLRNRSPGIQARDRRIVRAHR